MPAIRLITRLSELADVAIATPSAGEALVWDAAAGRWANGSLPTYDQSLNTTDDVRFDALDLTGGLEFGTINAYGEFSPFGGIGASLFTGGSSGLHVKSNAASLNLGAGSEFIAIDSSGNLSGTHLQNVGTGDAPTFWRLAVNDGLSSGEITCTGNDSTIGINPVRIFLHRRGLQIAYGQAIIQSGGIFGWSYSNANNSGANTPTLRLSQSAAGRLSVDTTANGNALGSVALANLDASGTVNVVGVAATNSRLEIACDSFGDATLDVASDSGSGVGDLTINAAGIVANCSISTSSSAGLLYTSPTEIRVNCGGGGSATRTFLIAPRTRLAGLASGGLAVQNNSALPGDLTCANLDASGTVKTGAYTVATLPAAATAGAGARAFVTDSDTAAVGNFGSLFSGGGANAVPVWSDGSNWFIG